MNSLFSSKHPIKEMMDGKTKKFVNNIDNVHMVWLEEIQQEAKRMFSRDFSTEPELMPKTPSQKKNSRRKRVSLGRQVENPTIRRFSKGRRSNLHRSSGNSLNLIAEEVAVTEAPPFEDTVLPKRSTRNNSKQAKAEEAADIAAPNKKPELVEEDGPMEHDDAKSTSVDEELDGGTPSEMPVVNIPLRERLSAEMAKASEDAPAPGAAEKAAVSAAQTSRRSSVRCSLKLRHSLAGLRHSMIQESVRRASRRSAIMKKKAARAGNSTCSSSVSDNEYLETEEEEEDGGGEMVIAADAEVNTVSEESPATPEIVKAAHRSIGRVTRSVAAKSPTLAPPALFNSNITASTPDKTSVTAAKKQSNVGFGLNTKRKSQGTLEDRPTKRVPPPVCHSAIKPHMKSFLQTVQKNQMLMMTPNTLGRTGVIKSFIKYTTPVKVDPKQKERQKLEALKKKQEQEEERMRKMEEEKKKKLEELRKKRDERLRRVNEAKVKEEQREEEKKKKIEQKMAQIDEKNDKLRQAEEKAKKRAAMKRQEELEQKRKLEEEARRKQQQAEEEKRQQEMLAKKKQEEEERALKLAEARRALELKREQERERELERERQAAAERLRVKKEEALALQRELERAAREKEQREMAEKLRQIEENKKKEELLLQQRLAEQRAILEREASEATACKERPLNVTMDFENSVLQTPVGKGGALNLTVDIKSPQSYAITPKGGNQPLSVSKNIENYGMDQNSDDSTDDESDPKKPIPAWAQGHKLQQIIMKQYFNPVDLNSFFGAIEPLKLEDIFYKTKPRFLKRTSSAVWHSPPQSNIQK